MRSSHKGRLVAFVVVALVVNTVAPWNASTATAVGEPSVTWIEPVRRLNMSSGFAAKYTVDSSGCILEATLGGESFTAVRPNEPAIRLLTAVHATRSVDDQQSTIDASMPQPVGQ